MIIADFSKMYGSAGCTVLSSFARCYAIEVITAQIYSVMLCFMLNSYVVSERCKCDVILASHSTKKLRTSKITSSVRIYILPNEISNVKWY